MSKTWLLLLVLVLVLPTPVIADDALPIIDVHLHVYDDSVLPMPPHPTRPRQISSVMYQDALIDVTIKQLDANNVVLALLHDTPVNIERLQKTDPDRFLAFPRVGGRFQDGSLKGEPSPEDFENHLRHGEWSGIGEIATVYNGLGPTNPALRPYYEMANRYGIPVFWHSGTRPRMTLAQPEFRAEIGRPTHWEDIFVEFPNIRPVLLHAGHPFRDDIVAVMITYPWVYVDTGPFGHVLTPDQFYSYFGYLIELGLGDRIMFGSDQMGWPAGIGVAIEVLKNAPWDDKIKRNILYNNAARFLGLSESQINSHHDN